MTRELIVHLVAIERAIVITFLLLHQRECFLVICLLDVDSRDDVHDALLLYEACSHLAVMETFGVTTAFVLAVA